MTPLYTSKYYADLHSFIKHGWTAEEINEYFPQLENMNAAQLLKLHEFVGAEMYKPGESVDPEQAIHVLVNPHDTPKELLISAIKRLNFIEGKTTDPTGAVITIDEVDFLITPEAASLIKKEYEMISLRRLIDNTDVLFSLEEVTTALREGPSDWLD